MGMVGWHSRHFAGCFWMVLRERQVRLLGLTGGLELAKILPARRPAGAAAQLAQQAPAVLCPQDAQAGSTACVDTVGNLQALGGKMPSRCQQCVTGIQKG